MTGIEIAVTGVVLVKFTDEAAMYFFRRRGSLKTLATFYIFNLISWVVAFAGVVSMIEGG